MFEKLPYQEFYSTPRSIHHRGVSYEYELLHEYLGQEKLFVEKNRRRKISSQVPFNIL
jgi:hypothetical protein